MTAFDPALAAIRFGTGRRAGAPGPTSARAVLDGLRAPDAMAEHFAIAPLSDLHPDIADLRVLQAAVRKGEATPKALRERGGDIRAAERQRALVDLAAVLARGIADPHGVRDRLTWFWADHFAVRGRTLFLAQRTDTYVEEAIRPHLTGRFADMLTAAVLHPVMLVYLDQARSVGPDSDFAREREHGGRGLNENLAREILELHTLGVGGGYDQRDVRQLAELLAGVTLNFRTLETVFRPRRGEPGSESILGYVSGAGAAQLADVHAVLDHLSRHPDTARHIARKLAVHFVADDPDPDLVGALAARWIETDGALSEVCEVLLTHPAAMDPVLRKVKRPVEYMTSALRGLGAAPDELTRLARDDRRRFRQTIVLPMQRMGQGWGRPDGPDGWPERPEAWITPATLAERLRWAGRVQTLPGVPGGTDPEAVLETALGPLAGPRLRRAIKGAETRAEAVALVLAAPEFQRR